MLVFNCVGACLVPVLRETWVLPCVSLSVVTVQAEVTTCEEIGASMVAVTNLSLLIGWGGLPGTA